MNETVKLPTIPVHLCRSLSAVGLNDTEAKILLYLAYVFPYATQEEISEVLGLSRSLVSTALSKMTSMGIVLVRKSGRVKEYYVKSARYVIRRLFKEIERTILPLGEEVIAAAKKLPRNQDPERQRKILEMEREQNDLIELFDRLFKMLGEGRWCSWKSEIL